MNLSPAGDFFIKNQEAAAGIPVLRAYKDGGGVWTIGWGHTGSDVTEGTHCTLQQAQALFDHDIAWAVEAVNSLVKVPLSQSQFDALVSFVFNIGQKAFADSTLLRLLNGGDYESAALQFVRWNHDNGIVVDGLTKRRNRERALFMSQPVSADQPPAPIVESQPAIENPMPDLADNIQTVATVAGMATGNPWIGPALGALRGLFPEIAKLFTPQGSIAERNVKAASAVLDAVMQATGAPNAQSAVEAVTSDPALAKTARSAVTEVLDNYGLMEVGGGIVAARVAAAAQDRVIVFNLTFIQILAVMMVMICAAAGGWVMVDPRDKFGDQIRAMIVTAMFIGGWSGILAYFFGSSSASRSKDATIAAQAEK